MTKSRIIMGAGIGLLAVAAIFGLTRRSEVAPQPYVGAAGAPVYPAPEFSESGVAALPMYSSRPSIRTIEQPAPAPASRFYAGQPNVSHRVVVKRRSRRNSVAIVAGSAGVGAAIGALAGGGPGAGIGALAGGAGGFVYDRLTHKRKVEQP